jgi:hypothetical protein
MEMNMAESHISDLTVAEFRALVRDVVRQTLHELIDPDAGLSLRDELEAELRTSLEAVEAGVETIPAEKLAADLGLEW